MASAFSPDAGPSI